MEKKIVLRRGADAGDAEWDEILEVVALYAERDDHEHAQHAELDQHHDRKTLADSLASNQQQRA